MSQMSSPGIPSIPPSLIKAIDSGRCVAMVGAGFTMASGLPAWSQLLFNVLEKCTEDPSIILVSPSDRSKKKEYLSELRFMLEQAVEKKSTDIYDQVAQLLEDSLGSKKFDELVGKQLAHKGVSPQMQKRLELLDAIPFRAILTTNYDPYLRGSLLREIYLIHPHTRFIFAPPLLSRSTLCSHRI